jgi:intracellular multiplication protein IcmP
MSQQGRGGGQEADHGVVYLIVFLLGLLMAAYYFFHSDFVKLVFYFKYYELKALNFFVPAKNFSYLINWMDNSQNGHISNVSFHDVKMLSVIIGKSLLWPFVVIGVIFSAILYFFHPDSNYKAIETMESLREKLKPFYPSIQVVSELDLVNQPINEGPWAMALTPIEFAKQNKLLLKDKDGKIIVDKLKSRILFSEQLGPIWTKVNVLPLYQRALFAALCLFADYKRDDAEKLLEQFSASATKDSIASGNLNFKGVDKIIAKYSDHPKVLEILSNHSYVMTVFSQMLTQARSTGIVASSSFLWLKPMDRKLWYTLNNVGRKAVFIETSAVTAHWRAEVKLGYALKKPMVDMASDALSEAIATRVVDFAVEQQNNSEIIDSEPLDEKANANAKT